VWASLLGIRRLDTSRLPLAMRVKVGLYVVVRRILGIPFVTKLLERHERDGLEDYRALVRGERLAPAAMEKMRYIIREEEVHESAMLLQTGKHAAVLDYTRSIVFGVNDGLVEILAVIAGVAMVATSGFVVALTGVIVGVSGTLSMAAGAYLSSKSERVVAKSLAKGNGGVTSPAREAYYTGIFYFVGALVATYPFMLGASGYAGILESVVSVGIVLSIASALIAIISDTGVKARILEMLAISLGTAFVTAAIGLLVRVVFGVTIS
jgi:VIT1/CCC1 family predicted Fe2+/Mn2+ transporter